LPIDLYNLKYDQKVTTLAATIMNAMKQQPVILSNISIWHTDRSFITFFLFLNTSAKRNKIIYSVNTIVNSMGTNRVTLAEYTVFFIWPDDGSVESKHVAKFLILIINIFCSTDWINYCVIENTTGWIISKLYICVLNRDKYFEYSL
jgi:hypothetical protein